MSLVNETYILPAEKREGRSGSHGSVFPLFNDTARPDFLKSVSRFDDITLRAGGSLELCPGAKETFFILPLAGSVDLLGAGDSIPIENGTWLKAAPSPGSSCRICNPFDQPVNFLLIGYDDPQAGSHDMSGGKLVLDNQLLPLHASAGFGIIVGRFGERESVETSLRGPGLLAYVLEGIFEVKDRLLQSRDALSVPDALSLDFECFTHGGLVLFICDNGAAAA
ncbi:MAG: hypothetical protein ABS46_12325 [Cytophagaceae bacterium SCN 52-12]|nr:MAG: hypothetical protein ABS46_12325 [Cytophagaceae bacterium SCN 52-12]